MTTCDFTRRLGAPANSRHGRRAIRAALMYCSTLSIVAVATAQSVPFRAPAKPRMLARFTIAKDGSKLIHARASLTGTEFDAVLDTGTSFSVYDSSLQHLLGPREGETTAATQAGSIVLPLFASPGAPHIGGLKTSHSAEVVYCHDLSALRRAAKHDFRAIFGIDLLVHFSVEIDFERGELRLWDRLAMPHGIAIPMESRGGTPWVRANLEGFGEELFELDTGSTSPDSSGQLGATVFNTLLRTGGIVSIGEAQATTVAGSGRRKVGKLSTVLSLGQFKHRELLFDEREFSALSLRFLSQYHVTLDFPTSTLYLSSRERQENKGAAIAPNQGGARAPRAPGRQPSGPDSRNAAGPMHATEGMNRAAKRQRESKWDRPEWHQIKRIFLPRKPFRR